MHEVDESSRVRPLWIQSSPSNDAYRTGWELIWGKKERERETESGAITSLDHTTPPSGQEAGQ